MNQVVLEALREKRAAEKMMTNGDYVSARDKLRKAQQLCPELANVHSMLAVCDILSSANIKIPGCGVDHYWVLQVTPSSTYSNIRSRYQKLTTLLQPIQKKFPGTELALLLIQDAFSVLSDEGKRSAFNLKRGGSLEQYGSLDVQASYSNNMSDKETATTALSSFHCKEASSQDMGSDVLTERTASVRPDLLDYVISGIQHKRNQLFADVDSQVNFSADRDTSAESAISSTLSHSSSSETNLSWLSKDVVQKRSNQDFYDFEKNRDSEFFEPGEIWAAYYKANLHHGCKYARIIANSTPGVSVTWLKPVPITCGERRWCDNDLPVACGSFESNPEMSEEVSGTTVLAYKCSWVHGVTEEQYEIYPKSGEVWALYKNWNLDEWAFNPDSVRACKFEFVEILKDFSKYLGAEGAWLEKVDGFKSIFQRKTIGGSPVICHIPPQNVYIFSHCVPSYRFDGGEMDKVVEGMFELDQLALPDDMFQNVGSKNAVKGHPGGFTPSRGLPSFKTSSETEPLMPSWSSDDFAVGQVWAVYSGKDLMPRQYSRVDKVISESQVCATLLEPLVIVDYEIDWKRKNLPIVCGIFKVSGTSVCLQMSQFSYLVKCQESADKPVYAIYPLKGEVWAMYKNWSHKWLQSDHDQYQCQVVQILSDFTEGDVITIAKLKEAKGCLTFFQTQEHEGFTLTHAVPRSEVLGFSHRIPAFRVPGIGSYGVPESSLHLEPNALPPRYRN